MKNIDHKLSKNVCLKMSTWGVTFSYCGPRTICSSLLMCWRIIARMFGIQLYACLGSLRGGCLLGSAFQLGVGIFCPSPSRGLLQIGGLTMLLFFSFASPCSCLRHQRLSVCILALPLFCSRFSVLLPHILVLLCRNPFCNRRGYSVL